MYHELTVWSRGIIMDKEARDVSSCIAAAARKAGYYTENVSDYIDDPDRTNCLVRRYARFGDKPILDRFVYENTRPDWVVLIEETIVKAVNFFRGTGDGEGVLVVNSARDPEYLLKFLPGHMRAKLAKLVVVDGVGLAEQRGDSPWMFVRNLSELAFDRMSTEGAVERLAIGLGVAAPLIGALVATTGALSLDDVAEVTADRDAMYRGAEQHRVLDFGKQQGAQQTATAPSAGAPSGGGLGGSSPRDSTDRRCADRRVREARCPYAAPTFPSTSGCPSRA